ncbi:MAG: hypothetical protein JW808_11010 [Victivallales bacterium]|nr:hypothetical protein [Victivallales bacterium]
MAFFLRSWQKGNDMALVELRSLIKTASPDDISKKKKEYVVSSVTSEIHSRRWKWVPDGQEKL